MESQSTPKIDNEAKSYIREWIAFNLLTFFYSFYGNIPFHSHTLSIGYIAYKSIFVKHCLPPFSLEILYQKLTEKRPAFVRRPALVVNTI